MLLSLQGRINSNGLPVHSTAPSYYSSSSSPLQQQHHSYAKSNVNNIHSASLSSNPSIPSSSSPSPKGPAPSITSETSKTPVTRKALPALTISPPSNCPTTPSLSPLTPHLSHSSLPSTPATSPTTHSVSAKYFQDLAQKQDAWATEKAQASQTDIRKALQHKREAEMVAERIYCDPVLTSLVSKLVLASSWKKVMPSRSWSLSLPTLLPKPRPSIIDSPPGSGWPPNDTTDAISSAVESLATRANAGDWAAMWLLDDPEISTVADANAMLRIGFIHAWGRLSGGCPVPLRVDEDKNLAAPGRLSGGAVPMSPMSEGGKVETPKRGIVEVHRHIFDRTCAWFRKAALLDNREAMVALGRLLICSGDDPGLGITWLIKAWGWFPSPAPFSETSTYNSSIPTLLACALASTSRLRHLPSLPCFLAECYGWGIGIPHRDLPKSFQWYRETYEVTRDPDVALVLAEMLEFGRVPKPYYLWGWEEVPVVALAPTRERFVEELRRRVDGEADVGIVDEAERFVDKDMAWHWYRRAAEGGNAVAVERIMRMIPPLDQM